MFSDQLPAVYLVGQTGVPGVQQLAGKLGRRQWGAAGIPLSILTEIKIVNIQLAWRAEAFFYSFKALQAKGSPQAL